MIIDLLQPALASADRLATLSGQMKRNLDSARRGLPVDISTDALEAELKILKKAIPRQKAVARAA